MHAEMQQRRASMQSALSGQGLQGLEEGCRTSAAPCCSASSCAIFAMLGVDAEKRGRLRAAGALLGFCRLDSDMLPSALIICSGVISLTLPWPTIGCARAGQASQARLSAQRSWRFLHPVDRADMGKGCHLQQAPQYAAGCNSTLCRQCCSS